MSSEIVVPETPNWLNDLEAKREQRLKVRLGHEAGAGAPCLKCGDECPGLDLHFWRKNCKICRCPKEEHDVHDDDIYGWAQFQLLGSKPNKVKTKITLPGKKDEVELEWAPKGQKDTIDKYLKTLPPEALPVKGSQAAQERKQLLQKQIPIHDIDPGLCHELNEDEVSRMEEYVDHVKNSSVGVGQIVNLSSVIKANLHNISPQEAHIIASRHPKSIPFNEIVQLQSGLAQNLDYLSLTKSRNKSPLPAMQPSCINITEDDTQSPSQAMKFKDITHSGYSSLNSSPGKPALYAGQLARKPQEEGINDKLLQETNFNPALTPSQFLKNVPYVDALNVKRALEPPSEHQYGFENPLFRHPTKSLPTYSPSGHVANRTENLDPAKVPKSVKDLMYSTYDPAKGPIPEDVGYGAANKEVLPGYEPNLVMNTYKHDPSVIPQQEDSEQLRPLAGGLTQPYRLPYNSQFGKHGFNQRPIGTERNNSDEAYASSPAHERKEIEEPARSNQKNPSFPSHSGDHLKTKGLPQLSPTQDLPPKGRKPLTNLLPKQLNVSEDFLEPHSVNIGPVQDINPDIRSATSEFNPGYQEEVYGPDYSPESIKEILNNIKLPDCHYCKKPFEENEFAVTIDRASVLFHANCFKCAGCNQCLADNIYFYHKETNNVYCGRDYAKIKGYPRCSACDELIFTKEYCLAENNTFHLKHFCCFRCDTPLAGQDYTLDDDKPYCLPCYEASKAAKCSTCEKVIKPYEQGCQLNGVHFHAEDSCFRCIVCSQALMGKKLLLREGKLYCSHDCFNGRNVPQRI